MLCDLPRVEALGPQILDIGERGGLPYRYFGHVYLGLAAHWRGNAERAEAELRNAVELEPPGAFAGQSGSLLARHLAYHGRADEVMELFESERRNRSCPASTGSTASARGAACSASLRRSTCVACTSRPRHWRRLWKGCVELGRRWITYDGRLVETRAGLVAAAARRWEEAERAIRHRQRDRRARCPTALELADLRRLHARMLLDRGSNGDHARAAEMLEEALSAYRTFGMPAYARKQNGC